MDKNSKRQDSDNSLSNDDEHTTTFLIQKILKHQLADFQREFTQKLREDFDVKITQLQKENSKIVSKLNPIANEFSSIKQIGKTLPASIVDYMMEQTQLNEKLEKIKVDYVTREDLGLYLATQDYTTFKDLKENREEVNIEIEQINQKLSDNDQNKKQMGTDIHIIRNLFLDKADVKEIRNLEKQMAELAPWEAIKSIYSELGSLVKKDLFEMHKNDFTHHFKRIDERLAQTPYKQETMSEIERMCENLKNEMSSNYLSLKEYQKDQKEYNAQQKKIKEEQSEFKKTFTKEETEINSIKRALQNKADDSDFKSLKNMTDTHATKNDLWKLEQNVYPKLSSFENEFIRFSLKAKQHDEIIRRYDEIITEKASKWSLNEFKQEADETFTKLTQTLQVQNHIKMLENKIQEVHKNAIDQFDAINRAFSYEILSAVKKVQKQQNLSQGPGQLESNFHIKTLLNMKANQSDVEHLHESKSSKAEVSDINRALIQVAKQTKHMIVLFVEFVRSSFHNPSETSLNRENKKKLLLQQSNALAKWVLRFDPNAVDQQQLDSEEDSRAMEQYTNTLLVDSVLTSSHISTLIHKIPQISGIKNKTYNAKQFVTVSEMQPKNKLGIFANRKNSCNNTYISDVSLNNRSLASPSQMSIKEDSAEYQLAKQNINSTLSKIDKPWLKLKLNDQHNFNFTSSLSQDHKILQQYIQQTSNKSKVGIKSQIKSILKLIEENLVF
ncbi:UNKNOWN [Stylonychia lemnae]|uniref:Uncharacterized protein n=1 Tax=Stylonychia lemnae TaxID=5949 RepID=A0A077ZU25_STYLE|nr:UNKNOWN [Stylonychia lemnae]|eukprot:CDW72800.1 UNKNOWN [Stylonychia lemnae]